MGSNLGAPRYYVRVFDCNLTDFSKNNMLAEFVRAKNVGIENYINDMPAAFFTINQDDPQLAALMGKEDPAHVEIWRYANGNRVLVFSGYLGKHSANRTDVVFYAYGYLSTLYELDSGWNITYTNSQIDTIINTEWAGWVAKPHPRMAWLTKGTVQAPVTTTGGATAVVLPTYTLYYKDGLHMLSELAILGRADTANTVRFEVTPSGVFNFWKNGSNTLPDTWSYGDGVVVDFTDESAPMDRRNSLNFAAANPSNTLLRTSAQDTADWAAVGIRQEAVHLSWVRDTTELANAAAARLKRALAANVSLHVLLAPNQLPPPPAGSWNLGDMVNIRLVRGITRIEKSQQIFAYKMLFSGGAEHMVVTTGDRPGV